MFTFLSAFNIDDDLNQPLADWYGVIMETSHYEPMMRGTPNERNIYESGTWDYTMDKDNIYKYWVNGTKRAKPCESIFTVGCKLTRIWIVPLSDEENIPLLEGVINDQRQILKNVFNETDVVNVPRYITKLSDITVMV
ncbi:glycoside hydrolase family 115 protein [Moniliophthora roreri]|nr:glycoside hydrolase family 115 protein [Moniliophthora roreri]